MENKAYQERNALVAKAMQGDKKAFSALCENEVARVVYLCTRYMGNAEDGQDAAQEVFIRLQKYLPTLKQPQAFTVWLHKLVRDVCTRMRQSNMRNSQAVPLAELQDGFAETGRGVIPEEYLLDRENRQELAAIIDALPAQMRECILLYYFSGLKTSEIADVMGIAEGSVKRYLYNGRDKMRKALAQHDEALYNSTNALLPMAALERFFRQDAAESLAPDAARRCLQGAGVAQRSGPARGVARNAALAAVLTLAAVVALASATGAQPAGHANAYAAPGGGVTQSLPAAAQGQAPSAAGEQAGETPQGWLPGVPPGGQAQQEGAVREQGSVAQAQQGTEGGGTASRPGPQTQPEQPAVNPLPPSIPAPPGAVPTEVRGVLAVQNLNVVEDTASLLEGRYYVTLERDGSQLGLAMVEADGSFAFDGLAIAESGTGLLRVHSVYNYGPQLAAATGRRGAVLALTPGQPCSVTLPLALEDADGPTVAVSLRTEEGDETARNPWCIAIEATAATRLALAWTIQAEGEAEPLLQGSTPLLERDVLAALPPGVYTLTVQVRDALGNEAAEARRFGITADKKA